MCWTTTSTTIEVKSESSTTTAAGDEVTGIGCANGGETIEAGAAVGFTVTEPPVIFWI